MEAGRERTAPRGWAGDKDGKARASERRQDSAISSISEKKQLSFSRRFGFAVAGSFKGWRKQPFDGIDGITSNNG